MEHWAADSIDLATSAKLKSATHQHINTANTRDKYIFITVICLEQQGNALLISLCVFFGFFFYISLCSGHQSEVSF